MSSRLRPGLIDYDEQAIVHHIENVERRIRIMCRVSQVFNNHDGAQLSTMADSYSDMLAWNEVFYEYVDRQMDDLKTLRGHLERNSTGYRFKDCATARTSGTARGAQYEHAPLYLPRDPQANRPASRREETAFP